MLPSCKHVAQQLSDNIDKPITGLQWLKMKIHLWICAGCRRYGEQIELSAKTIDLISENKAPNEELKAKFLALYRDSQCGNKNSDSKNS